MYIVFILHQYLTFMTTTTNQSHLNPVKEIIFGISFAGEVNETIIEKFINNEIITAKFPTRRPDYNASISNQKESKSQVQNIQINKTGVILINKGSGDKILHLKLGSLTYHRTTGYESFESLIKELSEFWKIFQSYSENLVVSDVSVRYLNFVEMDNDEVPADIVKVWVTHPFDNVINSFSSIRFNVENSESIEAIVVSTLGKEQSKQGIILDIIVRRSNLNSVFYDIEKAYDQMREIKNNIFHKCLSDLAKSKYSL